MAKITQKKKKWYQISAPKIFNDAVIGETLATTQDTLIGRHIKANLMNIGGEAKRQNINIEFKVISANESKAMTQVIGCFMTNSSIKRLVRKGNDRIDHSFVCETADNVCIRIKPLLLTIANTKRSVKSTLRKELEEISRSEIKKMSYDEFLGSLISTRFQGQLKNILKKIYPLRVCDIKSMRIETRIVNQKKQKKAKEKPKESEEKRVE